MEGTVRSKVGIGLLLIKDNRMLLLDKRKAAQGAGEYGGPGGHLELLELFEDCVVRELAEKVGININVKNVRFLYVTNLRKYAPKH
jgi:8-oxo-dGTP diphosphatase